MKNYIFLFFTILPYLIVAQQKISWKTFNSGGGTLTNSVTYSLGNSIIYKLKGAERIVTQGFQQPNFDIINITDIAEIPEATLIKTYPNPVNDALIVDYPSDKLKNLTLYMTDIQGRIFLTLKLMDNTTQALIPFQNYVSGEYLLIFKQNTRIIRTIKIIKQY